MTLMLLTIPSVDAGMRYNAAKRARAAHAQVLELGERLDAGDLSAAVPLRRAMQRRSLLTTVALRFGAREEDTLAETDRTQPQARPEGERRGTAADTTSIPTRGTRR